MGIERLNPGLRVVASDVDMGGIFFLNFGRVREHDVEQIARGRSAEDRSVETLPGQGGQVAAVVDMGMAEDDGVDLVGMEGEVSIPLPRLLAASLVQPTIQQDFVISDFQ
jgi:hypothetical protein